MFSVFSEEVHQLLLGSLMGDMYCRKEHLNSHIEETHSIKQKDYLLWKYGLIDKYLDLVITTTPPSVCKTREKEYIRKAQIKLRSKVSPKLNIYQELFYKDGKKVVNKKVLDQLNVLGLAVWYCDDGYYDPENKTIQIHTEGFSIEENLILKIWFLEKWKLHVNFKKLKTKKLVALRFPVSETDKFLELIEGSLQRMPLSIWYKLGHRWEGNSARLMEVKLNKKRRSKIYSNREDIRIRRTNQARLNYPKNRKRILKWCKEYRKTEKYIKYIRDYVQRPEVKERIRLYRQEYIKTPKYRKRFLDYQRKYRKRPEIKLKIKEYNLKAREKRAGGKKLRQF